MDEYDIKSLENETLLMVVASTFGNGDPPENGEKFAKNLKVLMNIKNGSVKNMKYAFFKIFNREYL